MTSANRTFRALWPRVGHHPGDLERPLTAARIAGPVNWFPSVNLSSEYHDGASLVLHRLQHLSLCCRISTSTPSFDS